MSEPFVDLSQDPQRGPVPQTLMRRIQQMILSGQIKPGDMLPSQRDLSAALGVSRTALREALTALEALGVIRIEPNRGMIVCAEPATDGWRFGSKIPKADIFQLRFVIDSYAARLAARAAKPGDLDRLDDSIRRMRGHMAAGDLEGFARTDLTFHHLIAEASGNQALVQTYDSIVNLMLESHRAPLVAATRLAEPITEHEAILKAIRDGDADGAAYFARNHVIRTADRSGLSSDIYKNW